MTKFAHIRPSIKDNRQGGYTIAFQKNDNGTVGYAVARCNPKDSFNKSIGRAIASGRLDDGQGRKLKTRAQKYAAIVKKIIPLIEAEIAVDKNFSMMYKYS